MDDRCKHFLLDVAKQTVEAVVKGTPVPHTGSEMPHTADKERALVPKNEPDLMAHCGCFVTLKNKDRLRGCIGQFTSEQPLIFLVADMAKASCRSDPRFLTDPITISELDDLHVEISVLSPLHKTDDPLSLRLGIDGIYIQQGRASGCLLPQVATETGWSKEEFLSYCCAHKAGLPAQAWQNADTDVYLFSAEVFGALFTEI
jgi:AmmeMemoRadiSam system protein A